MSLTLSDNHISDNSLRFGFNVLNFFVKSNLPILNLTMIGFLSYSCNQNCLFYIFISRFRRKQIIVVSFILSAVGAIGALLLSDKDDNKGRTCLHLLVKQNFPKSNTRVFQLKFNSLFILTDKLNFSQKHFISS